MLYYLYLKRKSEYITLASFTHNGDEVVAGMTITFASHQLATFARENPELKGMSSTCRVVKVYHCDGMSGIMLNEIA